MSQRPTIVLVHGAFHQPEHFDVVAKYLTEAGFQVVRPRLPSVGMTSDPGGALHLDAGAVRDALNEVIIQQGHDAILVMHSYGGLAGSEGYGMFQEGLAMAKSSRVRRLVYLAAHGAVEKGTALLPEGANPPHLSIDVGRPLHLPLSSRSDSRVQDKGIITHLTSFERFYEGDCTREEASEPISACLPMAVSAMRTPTKYAAWKDYSTPCTYIKCLNDRAVLPAMCDVYIKRMKEAGVDVEVKEMECGHSPAFVAPKELTELIVQAAR